jgi:YD repeat-containing protein
MGLIFAVAASASTATYVYDDAGRLIRVDRDTGRSTTYTLDAAGNRMGLKDSDGTTPTVPTGLAATVISPTQINLSWTASTDNIGVTGYLVERCLGATCTNLAAVANVTGAPPATTYQDTGVISTTAYNYDIRAQDASGNVSGGSTPVVGATTLDGVPPSAPGAVTATVASATTVNLSWGAATDDTGVTRYNVERCTGSNCSSFAQIGTVSGTPPLTTYSDTTAAQLTTYGYRVRANDARVNYGPYSPSATATTPDGTPPSAPTGLTATGTTSTAINLAWTPSTDNVGVTTYFVDRCAGAGCTSFAQIGTVTTPTPPSASYLDKALAPSSTYVYRVRAGDAAGNISGNSASASGTTLAGPPSVPVISPTDATRFTTTISVTWTTSAGATSYQLSRSSDDVTYSLFMTTPNTSATFTTGQGDHYYRVQACIGSTCSAMSNTSHILVCPTQGCP